MCNTCVSGACGGQKRQSDPLGRVIDDCKSPSGCLGLNSGRLEEWALLLTSEPLLQRFGGKTDFPFLSWVRVQVKPNEGG